MATVITSECINCGACEPECPNTAIYQGGVSWELKGITHAAIEADRFYIVPEKCTECVGFHDHEACAAVCPVDCCIPDPNIPEAEAILIARAQQLHPEQTFPTDFPSRFKKEGAAEPTDAPAPAGGAATSAAPPATAAAAKAAPAAAPPAPAPVAASLAAPGINIPPIDEWEVPIECHRCNGAYAVAFRHFRSGVVFRCPYCDGSYVVQSPMHNFLAGELRTFYAQWQKIFADFQARRQRELAEFEERQRAELENLNQKLRSASLQFKPPGAPKKRAGIFG
ncbi:MAG TPA: 4Fe-4S dicluster domain-containing protein [Terriglobales bacterium]|nr:4Fe-4S dicluster domain-containing protein [Terriglobales bacterium]